MAEHAHGPDPRTLKFSRIFGLTIVLIETALVFLYWRVATYPSKPSGGALIATSEDTVLLHYGKFQDVHVMIFVGFGFLMTFLKKYGFGSVGFNFLISAVTIQWALVNNGFWHQAMHSGTVWHKIEIDILSLITADFACGCVMITFGALLGKASPLELIMVVFLEMIVYAINENIGVQKFKAVDMGGSMYVHTFGAYFGLGCSWMITPKDKFEEDDEGSTYHSDMFAMIGTIFLWMFWPSFNGALATGDQQHRVIINTVIALTASCLMTFAMSATFRHQRRFDMVDVQNATLAGGVAVGSASDLVIEPWGAIAIGCAAGFLSVFGYTVIQPYMQNKRFVHDTCGVHNLHGMPGMLGGICGAISAARAGDTAYGHNIKEIWAARDPLGDNRGAGEQALYQLAAAFCSMSMAIAGGIICGAVINAMRNCCCDGPVHYHHDGDYWEGACDLEGAPESMQFPENVEAHREMKNLYGADFRCFHARLEAVESKLRSVNNKSQ